MRVACSGWPFSSWIMCLWPEAFVVKLYSLKWKRAQVYLPRVMESRPVFFYNAVIQSRISGFKCLLRFIAFVQNMRLGAIPLQLVPGLKSRSPYLCIKIRETPILHHLGPSLKKCHKCFFSLETWGRRPNIQTAHRPSSYRHPEGLGDSGVMISSAPVQASKETVCCRWSSLRVAAVINCILLAFQ